MTTTMTIRTEAEIRHELTELRGAAIDNPIGDDRERRAAYTGRLIELEEELWLAEGKPARREMLTGGYGQGSWIGSKLRAAEPLFVNEYGHAQIVTAIDRPDYNANARKAAAAVFKRAGIRATFKRSRGSFKDFIATVRRSPVALVEEIPAGERGSEEWSPTHRPTAAGVELADKLAEAVAEWSWDRSEMMTDYFDRGPSCELKIGAGVAGWREGSEWDTFNLTRYGS